MDGVGASIAVVAFASVLLVATGLKKQPGLGVLGAVVVIGLVLWSRGDGLADLGFAVPLGWVFLASDFGLWLVVLAHGFIDTVGIAAIALGADEAIRRRLRGASARVWRGSAADRHGPTDPPEPLVNGGRR